LSDNAFIPNPTFGVSSKSLQLETSSIKVTLVEIGGSLKKLWPNYYGKCDGLIYVHSSEAVDDQTLRSVFNSRSERTIGKSLPVLVVVSKYDLVDHERFSIQKIHETLEDYERNRIICFSVKEEGHKIAGMKALEWMVNEILQSRRVEIVVDR
jgi:GTPase SAR1 family protein